MASSRIDRCNDGSTVERNAILGIKKENEEKDRHDSQRLREFDQTVTDSRIIAKDHGYPPDRMVRTKNEIDSFTIDMSCADGITTFSGYDVYSWPGPLSYREQAGVDSRQNSTSQKYNDMPQVVLKRLESRGASASPSPVGLTILRNFNNNGESTSTAPPR